jgi:hypothetical protein
MRIFINFLGLRFLGLFLACIFFVGNASLQAMEEHPIRLEQAISDLHKADINHTEAIQNLQNAQDAATNNTIIHQIKTFFGLKPVENAQAKADKAATILQDKAKTLVIHPDFSITHLTLKELTPTALNALPMETLAKLPPKTLITLPATTLSKLPPETLDSTLKQIDNKTLSDHQLIKAQELTTLPSNNNLPSATAAVGSVLGKITAEITVRNTEAKKSTALTSTPRPPELTQPTTAQAKPITPAQRANNYGRMADSTGMLIETRSKDEIDKSRKEQTSKTISIVDGIIDQKETLSKNFDSMKMLDKINELTEKIKLLGKTGAELNSIKIEIDKQIENTRHGSNLTTELSKKCAANLEYLTLYSKALKSLTGVQEPQK